MLLGDMKTSLDLNDLQAGCFVVVEANRAADYLRLLSRYKQRSGCSPVFRLPTAGAAEVTCLSAVNEFYSCILSP